MISAGEIGGVLTVVDEASAPLRLISDQFERLDILLKTVKDSLIGINRSLTGLDQRLTDGANAAARLGNELVAGARRAATGIDTSFTQIDTAVQGAITKVGELKTELLTMPKAAVEASTLVPAVVGGGGQGGRPPPGTYGPKGERLPARGEPGFGGSTVVLPGNQRMHFGGTPALVAAGAVAYGAYEEGMIQDFVNKIFLTGGITSGSETANPLYQKIRDAITKTYIMTGLPLKDIEEGILTGTRGLAGIDLTKRLELMPGLLAASATEAYLKSGTTVPEAMNAFVGLAHMEGKYKPEEIAKLAEHFAFLSTTTSVSVEQVERAAGYAIPMLRTADFDPEQLLLMITSMERAGIMNTKAGTWISQLATQSFPGTSLMSKMLFKKHEGALKELGLVDDQDKPTWFTDGKPDLVKMTGIASEHIAAMDPAHRLAIEKALWGQQGGRAAGFFSDPTNRQIMANVAKEEPDFIAGEKMWKQTLQNSPIVQFRTTFAALNVELMNLGANVLPYVTNMLKKANEALGGKGELAALGGGLLAWMFRRPIGNFISDAVKTSSDAIGEMLSKVVPGIGPAAALTTPLLLSGDTDAKAAADKAKTTAEWLRGLWGSPATGAVNIPSTPLDPGIYERSRRASDAFRQDPEAAHARALSGMTPSIVSSIQGLPSQVQPAISSAFASIGAAISSAIAGMAASASAAAGAIHSGGAPIQVQTQTDVNIDGRKLSSVVGSHLITATRNVNGPALADASGPYSAWPDMQAYA